MNLKNKCLWLLVLVLSLMPLVVLAQEGRIYDDADLFSFAEESSLNASIDTFIQDTGMDFVVLTTDENHGKSAQAMADDFYDQGDFGLDSQNSGMLFYIDMYNRNFHLSTTGLMIDYLTDARIDSVNDAAKTFLQTGAYGDAIFSILQNVDNYVAAGIPSGQSRKSANEGLFSGTDHLVSLLFALCMAGFFFFSVRRGYRLTSSTYHYDYEAYSNANITTSDEDYIRTTVMRVRNAPEPSDNDNISSVHTGDSGVDHGGGGGDF